MYILPSIKPAVWLTEAGYTCIISLFHRMLRRKIVQGSLYIISAPSGAGKSSLLRELLATQAGASIQVSVSHTTRASRPGEINGQHYHFVSNETFEDMVSAGDFLEYATVFGRYYGTSHQAIVRQLQSGVDVFLDIDWQGARQVKAHLPEARSIFILPPSQEALYARLNARGQDSNAEIAHRMAQAVAEIRHYTEYDYIIINDDFSQALADLQTVIQAERLRTPQQSGRQAALISKLLTG